MPIACRWVNHSAVAWRSDGSDDFGQRTDGLALAGSRWWGIPLALFFFWFYYPTAIEYEDRKLHRIFGAAWEEWSARTPALMPRLRGVPPARAGDRRWSLAVSNRRNGELVFVVLALLSAAWVAWLAFR